jgi:hypothetical protein
MHSQAGPARRFAPTWHAAQDLWHGVKQLLAGACHQAAHPAALQASNGAAQLAPAQEQRVAEVAQQLAQQRWLQGLQVVGCLRQGCCCGCLHRAAWLAYCF